MRRARRVADPLDVVAVQVVDGAAERREPVLPGIGLVEHRIGRRAALDPQRVGARGDVRLLRGQFDRCRTLDLVARVLPLIVQERRLLLRHERGGECPRHDRERPPRPGDSPGLVPGAECERPVGKRSAVRLLPRLDRWIDRLAARVDGVLAEILQALLDVVAGEIRHHVVIRRADSGHDRQQPRRRLVLSLRRPREHPLGGPGRPSSRRMGPPLPRADRRRSRRHRRREQRNEDHRGETPRRPHDRAERPLDVHNRTTLTSQNRRRRSCVPRAHTSQDKRCLQTGDFQDVRRLVGEQV